MQRSRRRWIGFETDALAGMWPLPGGVGEFLAFKAVVAVDQITFAAPGLAGNLRESTSTGA